MNEITKRQFVILLSFTALTYSVCSIGYFYGLNKMTTINLIVYSLFSLISAWLLFTNISMHTILTVKENEQSKKK